MDPTHQRSSVLSVIAEDRDGSGSRRRAWELVAHAAVLAVMNAVGLLCCLLSEMLSDEVRPDEITGERAQGSRNTFCLFGHSISDKNTNYIIYA